MISALSFVFIYIDNENLINYKYFIWFIFFSTLLFFNKLLSRKGKTTKIKTKYAVASIVLLLLAIIFNIFDVFTKTDIGLYNYFQITIYIMLIVIMYKSLKNSRND